MNENIKQKIEEKLKQEESEIKAEKRINIQDERQCPFVEQNCNSKCAMFFIESKEGKGKCSLLKIAICLDAITYSLLKKE